MTRTALPVFAFAVIAVLAGLLLWSRRRRTSDDSLASFQESDSRTSRSELIAQVRTPQHSVAKPNAALQVDDRSGSDLDEASDAAEQANRPVLPPTPVVSGEGASEPEVSVGAQESEDRLQIGAQPVDAEAAPVVVGITIAVTTDSVELSACAEFERAHVVNEGISDMTIEYRVPGNPESHYATLDSRSASEADPVQHPDQREEHSRQLIDPAGLGVDVLGDSSKDEVQPDVHKQGNFVEEEILESTPDSLIADRATEFKSDAVDEDLEKAASRQQPRVDQTAAQPAEQNDSSLEQSESIATERLNGLLDALAAVTGQTTAPTNVQDDAVSVVDDGIAAAALASPQRRPTVYRDRRGSRRAASLSAAHPPRGVPDKVVTAPGEVSIRLSLHPIQRTVRFSLVLARPEGFPERITLAAEGHASVQAYDDRRYDDTDLPVGANLLGAELRFDSLERFQWLRSVRRVQIFSTAPSEPDLLSVPAARAGAEHAILCRSIDVPEVCGIADLAGSPPLVSHDGWPGVPAGCAVLSAYCPVRAVSADIDLSLRTLDPGASITIELSGLAVRARVFAQGHPPLIAINGLPDGTTVSIGGENAQQSESGAWVASGWDVPGRHTIDIVPGPSLTYEIAPDPASGDGWSFWNAYEERFGLSVAMPWERAEICGARVIGPSGSTIIAAETQPTMIALGIHSTAVALRRRTDAPVSVGIVPGGAAFLLSAWGGRRSQGRVIWIGDAAAAGARGSSPPDWSWIQAVRGASARRLSLVEADEAGSRAWREAVARASGLARAKR